MLLMRSIAISTLVGSLMLSSGFALAGSKTGKLSAKNIFISSLSDSNPIATMQALESSLIQFNKDRTSSVHNLNSPLYSGQKFRIRIVASVDGIMRVIAKNADGSVQELPSLPVQRGQEVFYPAGADSVLELDNKTGDEELVIALMANTPVPTTTQPPMVTGQDTPIIAQPPATPPSAEPVLQSTDKPNFTVISGKSLYDLAISSDTKKSKNIRLGTLEDTPEATYLAGSIQDGPLMKRIRIKHQ